MRFFWLSVLFLAGCSQHLNWMERDHVEFVTSIGSPRYGCKIADESMLIGRVWLCPTSATVAAGCDDSLWHHVYNSTRLQVHQMCVTVTGTIVDATATRKTPSKDGVRHEADGDCHGWLKLDPGQEKYLNAGNMSDEGGNLVYEIVCLFPVTQKDAISVCKGYKSPVKMAPVGSHVKMTGSWVMDDNHQHWNELHPVSSIEVIK